MSPRTKEVNQKIKEETQSKIELSAVSLFAKKGLSVTISEIAKKAGISQGLLYQYFASKDALITELIKKATMLSSEEIKKIVQNEISLADKINGISNMMIQMLQEPENIGTLFFLFMIQAGMNLPEEVMDHTKMGDSAKPLEYLTQIVVEGQMQGIVKEGNPFSLSLIYWGAVQGLCCFSLTGIPIPKEAALLSNILLK